MHPQELLKLQPRRENRVSYTVFNNHATANHSSLSPSKILNQKIISTYFRNTIQ